MEGGEGEEKLWKGVRMKGEGETDVSEREVREREMESGREGWRVDGIQR